DECRRKDAAHSGRRRPGRPSAGPRRTGDHLRDLLRRARSLRRAYAGQRRPRGGGPGLQGPSTRLPGVRRGFRQPSGHRRLGACAGDL
ncbi:MAG: hypothetical protein AVDCRST_MAG45-1009, partial [uncultured Solirubrobacterales bacterium]